MNRPGGNQGKSRPFRKGKVEQGRLLEDGSPGPNGQRSHFAVRVSDPAQGSSGELERRSRSPHARRSDGGECPGQRESVRDGSEARDDIAAGLAIAKENGVKLGRKPGIHPRVKVTPDQERIAREMHARGEEKVSIARATGLSRQYDLPLHPQYDDRSCLIQSQAATLSRATTIFVARNSLAASSARTC